MRSLVIAASICALLLVVAGAAMGHGPQLPFPDSDEAYAEFRFSALSHQASLNSALLFGFVHVLAALLTTVLPIKGKLSGWAGWTFLLGVVLFSGVLCIRAAESFGELINQTTDFTDRIIMLVPLGGLAFMAGWALLIVAAFRARPAATEKA